MNDVRRIGTKALASSAVVLATAVSGIAAAPAALASTVVHKPATTVYEYGAPKPATTVYEYGAPKPATTVYEY